MDKQEIIEGNSLIAVFMGFTRKQGALPHFSVPKGEDLKYKAFTLDINKMPYHESWDWLKPVVGKIGNISINYYQENNLPAYEECGKLLSTHIVVSIETVYEKVIQWIKWYNSQKQ